jgi:transposase
MSDMVLSREEKQKIVLDLYYNKGYGYRQIIKELKMSPNQIRDIIRRHEEKDKAIANRKRELSLSSKAYKLYSKGKIGCKWRLCWIFQRLKQLNFTLNIFG